MQKGRIIFFIAALALLAFIYAAIMAFTHSVEDMTEGINVETLAQGEVENKTPPTAPVEENESASLTYIEWRSNGEIYESLADPPECPELLLRAPTDLTLATSVLYPGQIRGNDFKPHGGLRFDNSASTDITVSSPFEGYVWRASQYLEDGNKQYLLDIIHPCGIMVRFDHLVELSPTLSAIVADLPGPTEGDSRTTEVEHIKIEVGDVLATSVGHEDNVFFDLGVYDLRKQNDAAQDESFREAHPNDPQATHALCWLTYLEDQDQDLVLKLPGGDGESGTDSAYC